jgi:hypothetical protein
MEVPVEEAMVLVLIYHPRIFASEARLLGLWNAGSINGIYLFRSEIKYQPRRERPVVQLKSLEKMSNSVVFQFF